MGDKSDWLKDVIQTIDDKQIDVKNVCNLIQTNKLCIETVVTDLCPFLTNTDTKERIRGTLILSTILYSLPNNYLSLKEVEHLTRFYCDRLKDDSVVPNLLTGLLAIVKCENYSKNFSPIIFNALAKEISVQQMLVSERFLVFNLLTKLFERSAEGFEKLLPMLLDAIKSEASEPNQRAALDAMSRIIDKSEQILNPCLKSCVSNFVNLSINSPHLSVRRSALDCLAQIADAFEDSELFHLRDQMVRDLRKALNDRKRVVRKSAVRARCKWILVGQPGK